MDLSVYAKSSFLLLARAVVKALKFCRITPIFRSLHWFKISERIEYKLLSLTYKALTTAQPTCLHSLITVQPPRGTCSSSVVTLSRPPTSSLKITNHSFRYASPHLWNQLPVLFCQPCTKLMMSHCLIHLPPAHHSHPPLHTHYFIPGSKLASSTNLFHHSLLAPICTVFSDYNWTGLTLLNGFFIFSYFSFFLFLGRAVD